MIWGGGIEMWLLLFSCFRYLERGHQGHFLLLLLVLTGKKVQMYRDYHPSQQSSYIN
jgi:hypothetical protein